MPRPQRNVKAVKIPDAMRKRIQVMADRTWDVIGYDVLQGVAECDGKNINSINIPRSEVIETVCDADYMLMHGGDGEAYKFWEKLSYSQQAAVVRKAFPHSRYGM